ncbi:hypothetical protein R3P38DRAFT_2609411 [Favolaschia claudopus]|uniref:SMP-30/Gluconolactonase/LRE-like region domain-containing protein n=1 Tax=Favolaschia claudopus TaxID=2862362 RepID=A0AAW0CYN8_9AGAR
MLHIPVFLILSSVLVAAALTFPTKLVLQSPTNDFFENLAVRPNGNILITSPVSSTLMMVDPTVANPTLKTIHTFPNVTLAGITEVQPDVYGLITLVLNITTTTALPGSIAVWRVDLSTHGPPIITKAASVPDAIFLDGLGSVPGEPDLVLGSDSAAGLVWQINLQTGAVRIAAKDVAFAPDASATPPFGINGLHIRNGDLFFTNTDQQTFASVPITVRGGNVAQAGRVEILGSPANATEQFDDFAFDGEGRAWVATNPNLLTVFFPPIQSNGLLGRVNGVGNPVEFVNPTSGAFGRGSVAQEQTLYVTTQTGQLIAVDTKGIHV